MPGHQMTSSRSTFASVLLLPVSYCWSLPLSSLLLASLLGARHHPPRGSREPQADPHRPGGGTPARGHHLHASALQVAMARLDPLPRPGLHGQVEVGSLGPPPGPQHHQHCPALAGAGDQPSGHPRAHGPGGADQYSVHAVEEGGGHLGPQGSGVGDEHEVPEVHLELGEGHDPRVGRAHHRAPRGDRGGGEEGEPQCGATTGGTLRGTGAAAPGAGGALTDADSHDATPLQAPSGKEGGEGGEHGQQLVPARGGGPSPGGGNGTDVPRSHRAFSLLSGHGRGRGTGAAGAHDRTLSNICSIFHRDAGQRPPRPTSRTIPGVISPPGRGPWRAVRGAGTGGRGPALRSGPRSGPGPRAADRHGSVVNQGVSRTHPIRLRSSTTSAMPVSPRATTSTGSRRRMTVDVVTVGICSPRWARGPSTTRARAAPTPPGRGTGALTERVRTSSSPASAESASSVRRSPMPGSTTVVPKSDRKPSAAPPHRPRAWERS